jgi:hypothetical protein
LDGFDARVAFVVFADAAAGVAHRRVVQRGAFVYVPRVRRRAAVE